MPLCLQGLRQEVATLAQRLDDVERASRGGGSSMSGWLTQSSRERIQVQPPKSEHKYETLDISSTSNLSNWLPKLSV